MADFDASEVRALAVSLAAAQARVGAPAAASVRKTASAIEKTAAGLVPVGDTGDLRDSISVTTEGDGRFAVFSAEIGPSTDYAAYVEYGTSDTAPQPFMRPAFDQHAPKLAALLGNAGSDIL